MQHLKTRHLCLSLLAPKPPNPHSVLINYLFEAVWWIGTVHSSKTNHVKGLPLATIGTQQLRGLLAYWFKRWSVRWVFWFRVPPGTLVHEEPSCHGVKQKIQISFKTYLNPPRDASSK